MTGSGLRRHHRFVVDVPAGVGARLRDISLSGMRVLTDRAMRMGENVETSLKTSYGVLRLKGSIVRGLRSSLDGLAWEYGIEFRELDAGAEALLRRYLDDCASSVAVEPEGPADALDVARLRDRIAELERASTGADSLPVAGAGVTADAVIDESRFATGFDLERFGHLVRLGQPLFTVVEDCAARVAGDDCQAVAKTFGERIDLASVRESGLDDDAALAVLFTFYERELIDFA